jgi:hypothetical protein
MRSSKLINESIAQKIVAKYGVECRLHDLKYFEAGFIFIFLEFIINLRAHYKSFEENIDFM